MNIHRSLLARKYVFFAACACLAATPAYADIASPSAPSFNVLALYSGTFDDAHINFEKEAAVWFPQIASLNNFSYTQSTNWDLLNNITAQQFQVVMFLDDQ